MRKKIYPYYLNKPAEVNIVIFVIINHHFKIYFNHETIN